MTQRLRIVLAATLALCALPPWRSGVTALAATSGVGVEASPTATACEPEELGSAPLPLTVAGTTADGSNSVAGSCGEGTTDLGPERAFRFVPPASGLYRIDTFGSQLDTVLYVREASCNGAEKACNDDASGSASALSLQLTAGMPIVIFVDGFGGTSGDFVLHIARVVGPTPTPILCSLTQIDEGSSVSGSTTGGTNGAAGTCGSTELSREQGFLFTPEVSGRYQIDTFGSDFDTVLYARAGGCGGVEVGCNDDAKGGSSESSLTLDLTAGMPIAIFVDGYAGASGAFVLNIQQHVPATPVPCELTALEGGVPVSVAGSTEEGSRSFTGSCAASDLSRENGYLFTPPVSGLYRIDTLGSDFDTVLYARAGDCDGAEMGCNDDVGDAPTSSMTLELTAGMPIAILVDGYAGASGNFVLNVAHDVPGTPSPSPTLTPTPGGATATRTPSPTFTATPTATPTRVPCLGDCSLDSQVTVDELIVLVRFALGQGQGGLCSAGNPGGTSITRAELLQSIQSALDGCAGQ